MVNDLTTSILYIEADAFGAVLFKAVAEKSGCQIDAVTTARAGFDLFDKAAARNAPYTLAVVSDSIKDINCLDVCQQLLNRDHELPIVIQVTVGSEETAAKAMGLGAATYIVKDGNQGFLELLPAVISRMATLRAEAKEKNALDALLIARTGVFQSIAVGNSIAETLSLLCVGTEEATPGVRCSVLLYDQARKTLHKGAAPSLPEFHNDAFEGIEVGEEAGSCGAAAALKKRVVVDDVMIHPYWEGLTDLAKKVGFKACLSHPILDADQEVLGTFAMYYDEAKTPKQDDLDLIETQASIASIAILRLKDLKELYSDSLRMRKVLA